LGENVVDDARASFREPLPANVFIVPASLDGADEDEEAENGCELSERFGRSRNAVVERSTGKDREYQDWKYGPD